MNETEFKSLIGRTAYYRGKSRAIAFGSKAYKIIDQRADGSAVELNAPYIDNSWVATSSIELVPINEWITYTPYGEPTDDIDEIFNRAAGTDRERLDAELKRLEARVAEIKAAIRVIDSL